MIIWRRRDALRIQRCGIFSLDRVGFEPPEGGEPREFPIGTDTIDIAGAKSVLEQLKQARPERVEVKMSAEDGVRYTHIVKVIDACTGLGLTGITLSPIGS